MVSYLMLILHVLNNFNILSRDERWEKNKSVLTK